MINILKVTKREETGKKMREAQAKGTLPVVVYGHLVESQNFWVNALDFTKMYKDAGESTIIELAVEGEKKLHNVLIHEVQFSPLTGAPTHIDLLRVRMDEEIEARIPVEFAGESPAVKSLGGMLLKNVDEILVSCLPAHLPHSFIVDITSLATFGDHFTVSQLIVPAKVKVLSDSDMVIAGVSAPRTAVEIASLDEKTENDVTKVEGVVKNKDAKEEEK
jgi:large subunit ribosomal protein L25